MKTFISFLLIQTVSILCFGADLDLDLQRIFYQDILIDGNVLAKGIGPDCACRYETVKKVLDLYKRPFTILDIGAAEGYFSFRAVKDYDACAIMIGDPNWKDNILEKLYVANAKLGKVVLLSKKVSSDDLAKLAEWEHFDVVLALNVLHHFDKDWKEAYDAILKLGDHIIIETPPDQDKEACGQPVIAPINACIDQEPHILLGRFRRQTDPTKFDRMIWISKQSNEIEERCPGINLRTFKSFNGCYPPK